jgi:hypothetical protein
MKKRRIEIMAFRRRTTITFRDGVGNSFEEPQSALAGTTPGVLANLPQSREADLNQHLATQPAVDISAQTELRKPARTSNPHEIEAVRSSSNEPLRILKGAE